MTSLELQADGARKAGEGFRVALPSQPEADTAAPHGTLEAYREYINEMGWMAAQQAELVMRYTEIGDDAGLEYAVRRLVAHTKAALDTLGDLKAMRRVMEGGHADVSR